ncbi:zinc finger protein [Dionaea muscipula]
MCQGKQQEANSKEKTPPPPPHHHGAAMDAAASCELCGSEASLYCQADDAYLCRKCDQWVHGANFLANRHIRCLVCGTCRQFTRRYLVGSSSEVTLPTLVGLKRGRTSFDQSAGSICDGDHDHGDETESSRSLKMPFLFL